MEQGISSYQSPAPAAETGLAAAKEGVLEMDARLARLRARHPDMFERAGPGDEERAAAAGADERPQVVTASVPPMPAVSVPAVPAPVPERKGPSASAPRTVPAGRPLLRVHREPPPDILALGAAGPRPGLAVLTAGLAEPPAPAATPVADPLRHEPVRSIEVCISIVPPLTVCRYSRLRRRCRAGASYDAPPQRGPRPAVA